MQVIDVLTEKKPPLKGLGFLGVLGGFYEVFGGFRRVLGVLGVLGFEGLRV